METRTLVAYASKYGSTKEVAESITKILQENGLTVDLEHAKKVHSLEEYSAVVLGAPIYVTHLHKDAAGFLSKHHEALKKLPVAIFVLGPLSNEEEEWKEARSNLDKDLGKFPWFRPVDTKIFGGKFDPKNLRFPDSLLARLPASPIHNMPTSDIRDWIEIRDWAGQLATRLQPALT